MAFGLHKNLQLLNGKQKLPYTDVPKGWYVGEEFVEILNKERLRSERSGLPLSFVLLDLSSINNKDNTPKRACHRFLEELFVMVSENTRVFDVKYFCNSDKVGVLLIDTGLKGAKAYAEKILSKFENHLNSKHPKGHIDLVKSMAISVFPIITVPNHGRLKRSPHTEEKKSDQMSKEISDSHLNWSIIKSNNTEEIAEVKTFQDFICRANRSSRYAHVKRMLDIVGSITGIIILSPMMLIVAILIKATSRGPVIFKQKRVGYLGKPFTFLKFRTMRIDSDDHIHQEYVKKLIEGRNDEINRGTEDKPLFKIDNDPRITGLGRILRKTSIDELPQLFNVLTGSMSIVGPRPPLPYETDKYQNWHWRRIMGTKPGITGLWQVYGRSKTTHAEAVRLDLNYIRNQSIFLDLKIILKTFPAILNTKGAL